MIDERRGGVRGEGFAAPHDLVAAQADREHLRLGDGLEDDLGADAGGIAHRDADARPSVVLARGARRRRG
jgi:hypothetical protein